MHKDGNVLAELDRSQGRHGGSASTWAFGFVPGLSLTMRGIAWRRRCQD
jgi:hypothetical protein